MLQLEVTIINKKEEIAMGKKVRAILLALALLVTTVIPASLTLNKPLKVKAADAGIDIVFNFTGADLSAKNENGVGYQLYTWSVGGGDGAAHDMTVSADGQTATYVHHLTGKEITTLRQGYIVRFGDNWDAKDFESDRFVDLSNVLGGTVTVDITSKQAAATINYDKVIRGLKITSSAADVNDLTKVTFATGEELTDLQAADIRVRDTYTGEYLGIKSITADATNKAFTIVLDEALARDGSYEIVYDSAVGYENQTFMVGLPDYYVSDEFENAYTYNGDDLGATWTAASTTFKVWAPVATDVKVNLYKSGNEDADDLIQSVPMTQGDNGTWVATVDGDQNGVYYTYSANVKGKQVETIDPYARTAGINGKRGMVINLASTNPEGWENDKNPFTSTNQEDAVIYELHVRDFSIEESSGVSEAHRGKYLAFTENGTKNATGQTTGLDYMKELGVTHVHLLPVYDYATVDESIPNNKQYNWGYDPQNYNLPEGSYSTNAADGAVRVNEFKQMVKSLHDNGISVIMDVVYGHVYNSGTFSVNVLTPQYFSRIDSNGSGCGNDTATERNMVSKFIVDSMVYWAKEYHIDGFRIDQVGLYDVDTVNKLVKELKAIDPKMVLYGEGWSMATNTSKKVDLATQSAAVDTPGFGYFNDEVRDSLKGGVFNASEGGYVTGEYGKLGGVLRSLSGEPAWADDPDQVINYNSCHDNYALWDRLRLGNPNKYTEDELKKSNSLAAAIVFTSQGVPFLQAGEEIYRTKTNKDGEYVNDSVNSPDAVNSIKWDTLNDASYAKSADYYKGLIAFRKAHAALRMTDYTDIWNNMVILADGVKDEDAVIEYQLNGGANGETSNGIVVILNPSKNVKNVKLPIGNWNIYVDGEKAGTEVLGTAKDSVEVQPISAMVLVCEDETAYFSLEGFNDAKYAGNGENGSSDKDNNGTKDNGANGTNNGANGTDSNVNGTDANGNGNGSNGANGTNGTKGEVSNQAVKTGDNTLATVAAIIVMLVACAGAVVVLRKKKFN